MNPLEFPEWKCQLQRDAATHDLGKNLKHLSDYVLQEVFWKKGCEPTIAALCAEFPQIST